MINKKLNKNSIIGKGWQYTVYDLGNGRVYKKFNSRSESFMTILIERWFMFWKVFIFAKEMRINAVKSLNFLDDFLQSNSSMKLVFGNFIRRGELDFEQDKVIPLKKYFKNCSSEDGKIIIDKFIRLCEFLFVEHGFMDKTLKMARNFGINKNGDIILMDIGEIWFEPVEINKQIKKRVWTNFSEIIHVPRSLRKYYIQEMDRIFLNKVR